MTLEEKKKRGLITTEEEEETTELKMKKKKKKEIEPEIKVVTQTAPEEKSPTFKVIPRPVATTTGGTIKLTFQVQG